MVSRKQVGFWPVVGAAILCGFALAGFLLTTSSASPGGVVARAGLLIAGVLVAAVMFGIARRRSVKTR